MKHTVVIISLLLCLTTCVSTACGEEEKTVYGTVAQVDWVGSKLTVRYPQPFSAQHDEINIKVPKDTEITRGTEEISLSDILQSDQVTVSYFDDGLNGLKAIRIADLNLANR